MIFVAYGGGDPFDIKWIKQSGGVCEVYSDEFGVCLKGSNIKEVFSLDLIFNYLDKFLFGALQFLEHGLRTAI